MTKTLCLSLFLMFAACTQNGQARNNGGTAKYCTDPGRKMVNITWKEASLWILTRPMHDGEVPETYEFDESSAFGLLEGKVIVQERAAGDTSRCTK